MTRLGTRVGTLSFWASLCELVAPIRVYWLPQTSLRLSHRRRGGYTVSAAFFCIVYRGLADAYRPEYSYLRTSFWFRVLFLASSIVLVSGELEYVAVGEWPG